MTRADALQRLAEVTYEALNASEEFVAACAALREAGLREPVMINIQLVSSEPTVADPRAADADFLRNLHIVPNLHPDLGGK
jgi:hypothetical protein